jgi:hypothetical protein
MFFAAAGHEKESQAKVKKYMTIMDSMTDKELDTSSTKILVSVLALGFWWV